MLIVPSGIWPFLAALPNASYGDSSYKPSQLLPPSRLPVCIEWNEHPMPGLPHPSCHYEHVCYRCVHNPSIPDRRYKAIHCPNKEEAQVMSYPFAG